MSNFFGLFGCFKGKQDKRGDQQRTIQDSQRQGHERQNSQGKNAKVLPHGQPYSEQECARCGREIGPKSAAQDEISDKHGKGKPNFAINEDDGKKGKGGQNLCH